MKKSILLAKVILGVIVFCFLFGKLEKGMGEGANVALGKIGSSKVRYVKKDHEAWQSKGRIVGIAKDAPDFKVTVMTPSKRVIKTVEAERLKKGNSTYEVWLEPGIYIMLVSAGGYETLDLEGLEVRAGNDLRMDLEFGR